MLTRELRYCARRKVLTAQRQPGACASCIQSDSCGSALLSRYYSQTVELPLSLPKGSPPQDGAEFRVSMSGLDLLRICTAVFLGLSAAMLGGAWLSGYLYAASGDAAAAGGALAGLAVGALVLRLYDSRFGSRGSSGRLLVVPTGRVSSSDS